VAASLTTKNNCSAGRNKSPDVVKAKYKKRAKCPPSAMVGDPTKMESTMNYAGVALTFSGLVIGLATLVQNVEIARETGVSPLAQLVNGAGPVGSYHMRASVNPINQWIEVTNTGSKDTIIKIAINDRTDCVETSPHSRSDITNAIESMKMIGMPAPDFWYGEDRELDLGGSVTVLNRCQGKVVKLKVTMTHGYYDWNF
jgi:hypothetical protein